MNQRPDVRTWAGRTWPEYDWAAADIRNGAFHEVAVLDEVVARMVVGSGGAERVEREVRILEAVKEVALPVDVPTVVAPPLTAGSRTGYLITRVHGALIEKPWSQVRDGYAGVLAALAQVRPEDVPGLPPVRAWCGGERWPQIVEDALAGRLGRHTERARHLVATAVSASVDTHPGLVHGDFGPHNVLWADKSPSGLIDLDHMAWADPAIDLAPLIGHFGADAVAQISARDSLERAMYYRATLSLQVAAAAHLVGNDQLCDHAVANFIRRAQDGTTYDPGGRHPSPR